jgi:hypothetical protein
LVAKLDERLVEKMAEILTDEMDVTVAVGLVQQRVV